MRTSRRSFGDKATEVERRQVGHVQKEDNKTLDRRKLSAGWEERQDEDWLGVHQHSGRINLVEVNVGKLVMV